MQAREKSGGVMRLSVDDRIASPDFITKIKEVSAE